jgi:hypothetical protein
MSQRTNLSILAAVLLSALFSFQSFAQVSLPFTLGKEYLRSELTAVVGTPEKYGYDTPGGADEIDLRICAKGVVLNQYFSDLKLNWESDEEGYFPEVDLQSDVFTERRAPLTGIVLTDPTYRILEDRIPGGLYVGMQRSALKNIEGKHADGRKGGLSKNHYRIVFEDGSMVFMYYNAWDRLTFIEYLISDDGIFIWPKDDPYAPVDEKDVLVTTFHGLRDIRDVMVPSNPVDAFALLGAYNLRSGQVAYSGSGRVSLAELVDYKNRAANTRNKENMVGYVPFRQYGELKAVLHDDKDSINWDSATDIRWSYVQESNSALLKDYIVAEFAKKGYESNVTNYSALPVTSPTRISVYMDFQGHVRRIRINHGGRILSGRFLEPGEALQPGETIRYVTVYKEEPQPKALGHGKQETERKIVGTYSLAESEE